MANTYVNKVQLADGTSLIDISSDTVTADKLMQGYTAHDRTGALITGTATGGGGSVTQDQDGYIVLPSTGGGSPSATQHTIHLEFSDSTDADISVYYDDSLLGTMITAYEPSTWTYSSKTVTLAQLDNVTWYDKQSIPIGVELIDFTKLTEDYVINSSGQAVAEQWYCASDYTPIESGMTFSYSGCRWFYLGFYDSTKSPISTIYIFNDTTESSLTSNLGEGTLSGNEIPQNAAYVRITGVNYQGAYHLSLIRTA